MSKAAFAAWRFMFLALAAASLITWYRTNAAPISSGTTYYVSKNGNNADGRSWSSAWNELNQINWSVVQPGDTILLDGGTTNMTYRTSLTVGTSGTSSAPLTIRLATETGHNGQALIFGGRTTPLPYVNQADYVYQTAGVRSRGITINQAYIVIDGTKWRGIVVSGHNGVGVRLEPASSFITLRHLEVYDNGQAIQAQSNGQGYSAGNWYPDGAGIQYGGSNLSFERIIIHDNGQDSFSSHWQITNSSNNVWRQIWSYNARKKPDGTVWNFERHTDAVQVYTGGLHTNWTFEDSIFGPGHMQGLILGDSNQDTRVNNVTIRNSLFYGNGNPNGANDIHANHPATAPSGWVIENVTIDHPLNSTNASINYQHSTPLVVRNSIFTGGSNMLVPDNGSYAGNYQYSVEGGRQIGTNADPQYADPGVNGARSLNADYRLAATSPASGKGSSLTSVAQLLALPP